MYDWRMYVEAGGLMSYGPSLPGIYGQAAPYIEGLPTRTLIAWRRGVRSIAIRAFLTGVVVGVGGCWVAGWLVIWR